MGTQNFNINLEICTNTEWLREHSGMIVERGCEDEAADELHGKLVTLLESAGYNTVNAKGQRRTFHGWNGANTFKYLLGPVGTFDALTPGQVDEILDITGRARRAVEKEFA